MKWMVLKHYRLGPRVFEPGQVVEVEEVWARAINEDEPGTLRPADSADVPADAPEVEARQVEQPAQDRVIRRGDAETRRRGGKH